MNHQIKLIFRTGSKKCLKVFRNILSLKIIFVLLLVTLFLTCISNMFIGGPFSTYLTAPHKRDVLTLATSAEDTFNSYAVRTTPTKPQPKCVLPKLEVDDPVMMKFYQPQAPVRCSTVEPDWVYVDNGTLRFHSHVTNNRTINCGVFPLVRKRGDDTVAWGLRTANVTDGWRLTADFFKVDCHTSGSPSRRYADIHIGVAPNAAVEKRFQEVHPPANGLSGLSLLVLGFDSMSRMSWIRRMKKTRDYFINTLKGLELEGYNIMGDGTPAALFPMLTGRHETEMHEARRKFKGATPVDDFPWIWKDFEKSGYMTSWADSEVYMAPFNLRLLGFQQPPTDYYMRPYYLGEEFMRKSKSYKPHCKGSVPKHKVWLNWPRDLYYMYGNKPKFMFHFYATLSHQDNNELMKADEDLMLFLQDLENKGYLNQTILVVMGDHGARFAKFRASVSGKLEERLPYMGFRFPPWFEGRYPQLISNFKVNIRRLTSPLDIHETFKDVLRFDGAGLGNLANRGISLFKEIPLERDCGNANISNHWCACLNWEPLPVQDAKVITAAQTAIDVVNNLTSEHRVLCSELTLENVTSASRVAPNDDLLKFKQSSDAHGRVAEFTDNADNATVLYQVTFYTQPGHGQFEVTVTDSGATDEMAVNEKEISRINEYGSDPACIMDKNRQLRQYCYCKQKGH